MANPLLEPRKRQLARLSGAKPPSPRAAMALAKSQEYQNAADAPSTLRVYAGDLANFSAWCERHGFTPMPATPEIYLRRPVKAAPCQPCDACGREMHREIERIRLDPHTI
jgi:hypothetical protein